MTMIEFDPELYDILEDALGAMLQRTQSGEAEPWLNYAGGLYGSEAAYRSMLLQAYNALTAQEQPSDVLSAEEAAKAGLDSTGRDGDPRFPYRFSTLTPDERARLTGSGG